MEPLPRTHIFSYTFDATPICFEEGVNGITPIPYQSDAFPNQNPSLSFLALLQTYQENTEKIRSRYAAPLNEYKEVDLSNLGLTQIPPHILLECQNAHSLNLSGNDLHFLPCQLQALHLLASLDISGNRKLQPNLPPWIGKMPNLHLTANNMGLHFIPKGFTSDRFTSNDLPPGVAFGETQQSEPFFLT